MNRIICAHRALALCAVCAAGCSVQHVHLAGHADSVSYALGALFAQTMIARDAHVEVDSLVAGVRYGLARFDAEQHSAPPRVRKPPGVYADDFEVAAIYGALIGTSGSSTHNLNVAIIEAGIREGAGGASQLSESIAKRLRAEILHLPDEVPAE